MPTPTEVTELESFEVISPVDVAPPGAEFEAYVEKGVTQLVLGDQVHPVPFNTQKASLSYVFDELVIFNEVDASPIVLGYIETAKTVDGFEITTSASPDTGNYYVRWKVRIPTTVVDGAVVATPSTGAVTEVTAVGQDGIHTSVANSDTAPTITVSITDGGIPISKLAEDVLVDDGTVATKTGAETLTNKLMDGNNNTFTNISLTALTGDGIIAQNLGSSPASDQGIIFDSMLGNFRFTGTPTVRGLEKNIYVAERTDSKPGTGTADDPFDGSGSGFDTLMDTLPEGATINLGAGVFLTDHLQIKEGWVIRGSLCPGGTVIRLNAGVADSDGTNAWVASYLASPPSAPFLDTAEVHDVTFDTNRDNQGIYTSLLSGSLNGIEIDAKSAKLHNVVVLGAYANPGEGFPCCIVHDGTANDDNSDYSEIVGCKVIDPVGYMTAQSIFDQLGGYISGQIKDGIVSDSTQEGLVNGFGGRNLKNFVFDHCTAVGVKHGVVIDTDDFLNTRFVNCHIESYPDEDVSGGHGIVFNGSGTYDVVIEKCYVKTAADGGVPLIGPSSGSGATVRIANNELIALNTSFGAISINNVINKGTVHSNVVNEGTTSTFPTGITPNGNVNASGTPIYAPTITGTNATYTGSVAIGGATTGKRLSVKSADNTPSTDIALFSSNNGASSVGIGYNAVRVRASGATEDLHIEAKGAGFVYLGSSQNTYVDDSHNQTLCNGLRLNGGDTTNTIYSSGNIGITAGGSPLGIHISSSTGAVSFDSGITDATNIALGTGTGTKLGTATGQKLGFWGATPVAQQLFATGASHTVDELITVLQTIGLLKQS